MIVTFCSWLIEYKSFRVDKTKENWYVNVLQNLVKNRYNSIHSFCCLCLGLVRSIFVSAVSPGIGAGSRSFSQYLRAENRSCGPVWAAIRLSRSVPIFDQDSSLSFEGRSCACIRFADTRKVILIFCCRTSPERTILLLKWWPKQQIEDADMH